MSEVTAQVSQTAKPYAEVLPPPSAKTFQELLAALRNDSVEARAGAARSLRDFAPECVEPLCAALKDEDEAVRAAAAESLGVVGDESAVQPLVEALRAGFPGKSPRRHRLAGKLLYVLAPLAVVAVVGVAIATKGEGLGAGFFDNLGFLPGGKNSKMPPTRTFADALAKIAERSPTPQLREALPDLHDIAADQLQQDKRTRATSRAAARKIEALTVKLGELPVTSEVPASDSATLPRVS